MSKEEDKTPKHIKEFHKKKKQIKQIIETTRIHYSDAYNTQAKEHLFDEETGLYDHDRLKDKDLRIKMGEGMVKYLTDKAKAHFKSSTEDPLELERLLKMYSGATKRELMDKLEVHQHKYTSQTHEGEREKFLEKVTEEIRPLAHSHLEEKHLEDILDAAEGAKDLVNVEGMKLQDALMVYDIYEAGNKAPLTSEAISETYRRMGRPAPTYLKKKDKKEDQK